MTEMAARKRKLFWTALTALFLLVSVALNLSQAWDVGMWGAGAIAIWCAYQLRFWSGYLARASMPPFGLTPAERNTFAFYAWQCAYREISPRAIGGDYHARAASALRWIAVAEQLAADVEFPHKAWVQQTAERWLTEEE